MFLCDPCHERSECASPMHLRSNGPCESCGKSTLTHDCHYISPAGLARVRAQAKLPNHNRYFLAMDDHEWGEVDKEGYVKAERLAGFHNTMGMPDEPATAAFGGPGPGGHEIRGKIEYAP
jgi:hypothetical protein